MADWSSDLSSLTKALSISAGVNIGPFFYGRK